MKRDMVQAAKSANLSALLQTGAKEIHRFRDPHEVAELTIDQPFETRLNKLKKSNPEAFS